MGRGRWGLLRQRQMARPSPLGSEETGVLIGSEEQKLKGREEHFGKLESRKGDNLDDKRDIMNWNLGANFFCAKGFPHPKISDQFKS